MPDTKQVTCIICPMGCRIGVETDGEKLNITGQGCRRGEDYARSEITAPQRMITGVVAVKNWPEMLPVKSAAPIPKDKIRAAMDEIRAIEAQLPVRIGAVILKNLAGTGVKLVATKNAGKVS
jgi:CxxC motif-containing protein